MASSEHTNEPGQGLSRSKKRFISGAVCPGCGATETIYVLEDETGVRSQHCSRCDFTAGEAEEPDRKEDPDDGTWVPVRLPRT